MSYYEKYLKYKTKYLNLKAQIGGATGSEELLCSPVAKDTKLYQELRDLGTEPDSLAHGCKVIPIRLHNAPEKEKAVYRNKLIEANKDKIMEELRRKLNNKEKIGEEWATYFIVLEKKYNETKDKQYSKLGVELYNYLKKEGLGSITQHPIRKEAPKIFKIIDQK
jgi:hypothetical protein